MMTIYFQVRSTQNIPLIKNEAEIKAINGLRTGTGEFISNFNCYIKKVNHENWVLNTCAAWANLLSTILTIQNFLANP